MDGAAEAGDSAGRDGGDRSVRDVCREHGIAEAFSYGWRDKILEAGREALAGKEERQGERELNEPLRESCRLQPLRGCVLLHEIWQGFGLD